MKAWIIKLAGLCCGSIALSVFLMSGVSVAAPYAIVGADYPLSGVATNLVATGKISSIDTIDAMSGTPTLAQLSPYTAILAFTNYSPSDGTALGNVLANYVNGGGNLVLATYGFSSPWAISGQIMTPGYSPFVNAGVNGDVSGNLVAVAPGDPLFNGISLGAVSYYHNGNFSHPGLDSGATLLATDGSGVDMIARNANGNVLGVNLFPMDGFGNNGEFYSLIANGLTESQAPPVPEPSTFILFGAGIAGVAFMRRKKA